MKAKTKLSFQQLLDKTKRIKYINEDVVASVEPCEPQELEFFTLGRYVSDEELEREYASRGLEVAHPYALTLFSLEHEAVMDEKRYVATHWKDADGKWCFATFSRWSGERFVSVDRRGSGWSDGWSFAGLRKSSALKPSVSALEPLSLELRVKNLEDTLEAIKQALA